MTGRAVEFCRASGSTGISTPLSNWTRLPANQLDGGGNFNFTNLLNTNSPQSFYVLKIRQGFFPAPARFFRPRKRHLVMCRSTAPREARHRRELF